MKTKIYLLILLALIIVSVYTLAPKSSSEEKFKAFKVEDFDAVNQIILTSRKGQKLVLKKVDNAWIVNDKYPVRQHLFDGMKEALTQMEIISPVANVAHESALNEMIENAIEVEIYKKGKLEKTILIGGPNFENNASRMLLEINGKTSERIYNVSIPKCRCFLTTRFLPDEREWRSKKLFSLTPQQVALAEIKYFGRANFPAFELKQENHKVSVKLNDKTYTEQDLNTTYISNYLLQFDKQHLMAYTTEEMLSIGARDSLLAEKKYADFTLTDTDGKKYNYTITDMPLNRASKRQYDEKGYQMTYDIDYFYLYNKESKEWGLIANDRFGRLLINPELFLK